MSEAVSYSFNWSNVSEGRKTVVSVTGGGIAGVVTGAILENEIHPSNIGRENLEAQIEETTSTTARQALEVQKNTLDTQHYEYSGNAFTIGLLGGLALRAGFLGIKRLSSYVADRDRLKE
jgi:hypothetical protein